MCVFSDSLALELTFIIYHKNIINYYLFTNKYNVIMNAQET